MTTTLKLTKGKFDSTNNSLEKIVTTPVDTIELEVDKPPTIDELSDSNKSYKINCAILFIDIRKSTDLSDVTHAKNMVKIYRSFMRMTVQCVRDCGGVTRQFLGDRIMGVFMDETDEDGNTTTAVDKAVYAARCMNSYLDYSLNNLIYKNINKKYITCGIGIAYGNVLVTQVGMRGVENDETKENEKDVVWVGKITNYASKYADLAKSGEIFINKDTYKKLSDCYKKNEDNKPIWHEATRTKGEKHFIGYISEFYYVDDIEEFGYERFEYEQNDSNYKNPFDSLFDSMRQQSVKLVKEISLESERLAKKECQLQQKEKELNERENYLINLKNDLDKKEAEEIYKAFKQILSDTWCKDHIIRVLGLDYWNQFLEKIFNNAKKIGKTELQIKIDICYYVVAIYIIFELFDKAYEYLLIQAEYSTWLSGSAYSTIIPKIRTKWALELKVKNSIKNATTEKVRNEFKAHLDKIKVIPI